MTYRLLLSTLAATVALTATQSSAQYTRELDSLVPANGLSIVADDGGELVVANAGDINGDALDDIIVGRPEFSEAYIIFGSGGATNVDLSTPGFGFRIVADALTDRLGAAVAGVGDLNNDGFDDVAVGAPGTNADSGAVHILMGSDQPFPNDVTISEIAATFGVTFVGTATGNQLGVAVAGGQDINADAVDDLVMSAPFADTGATDNGDVFVVYGNAANFAAIDLATPSPAVTKISGLADEDRLGISIAISPNLNAVGPADLVVGAPGVNTAVADAGAAYAVFGVDGGLGLSIDLSTLDGNNGFSISGNAEGDLLGTAVGAIGDLNNDGLSDIALGAPRANTDTEVAAGKAYVVFGSPTFSATFGAETLTGASGIVALGPNGLDSFGTSVSAAGDLNGDGIDDLAIGASNATPEARVQAGRVHVIYGQSAAVVGPTHPLLLDARRGVTFNGATGDEGSGISIVGRIDLNVDGTDDLLIATRNGLTYGVFGEAAVVSEITPPAGSQSGSRFGGSVDVSNNRVIISLPGGGAAVYRLESGAAVLEDELTLPPGFSAFDFGAPVTISGATVAIGARAGTSVNKGAEPEPVSVAIYTRDGSGSGFTFSQAIGGNQGFNGVDGFGRSLDLSGNFLAIGAPTDSENEVEASGAVYVYLRADESQPFVLTRKVKPVLSPGGQFGSAVRISGRLLAVGSPTAAPNGTDRSGEVSVYDLSADPMIDPLTIVGSSSNEGAAFGSSVNFDGPSTLLVGAPFEADGGLNSSGTAYVFEIQADALVERQQIRAREVPENNALGFSVEINDRRIAIGAPGSDTSGAIYLFRKDAQGQFQQESRIGALEGQGSLGTSVGISGDRILGGAPLSRNNDGSVLLLIDPSRLFSNGFEG